VYTRRLHVNFRENSQTKTQSKMSTNIRVKRKCEYCKKEFTAKTIRTRYCSHQCNSRAYKKIKSEEKIKHEKRVYRIKPPVQPINNIVSWDYTQIQSKQLLTINEACALLSITQVTLRRWLKDGIITSGRIGKKHLIHREHLNQLLS
jgi:excisionase family DNA binding protein